MRAKGEGSPKKKGDDYKITLPDTYPLPDGMEPGGKWDATVSLRMEEDGSVCVESVDGVPLKEGEKAEPEETEEVEEVEETETTETEGPQTMQDAVMAHKAGGGQF